MINELTFCELRAKEIINASDGKKLGKITDIVFSVDGVLKGIVVPYSKKMVFFKSQEIFIPFCNIKKIGEDVIIVELPQQFNSKNCITYETNCKSRNSQNNNTKKNTDKCEQNNESDCDNRCEKCMLFDCKRRWNKQKSNVNVDNNMYYRE